MKKTFLFGAGAQKTGTTWLYQYLKRNRSCAMSDIKEFSIFNAVYQPDQAGAVTAGKLRRLAGMLEERTALADAGTPHKDGQPFLDLLDNLAIEFDPSRYPDYFDRLLAAKPGSHLTGDITPFYCALSAENYRAIRLQLENAGYDVKVVFLMRDPVERCYSAIRMGERNRAAEAGKSKVRPVHERFAMQAVQPWCEVRTRYELTVPALESAFGKDRLFFGFYESFISDTEVRRLCDFLEIPFKEPNVEHKANASPRVGEPSAEDIAKVRDFYAETYRFCEERFGEGMIRSLWKNAVA